MPDTPATLARDLVADVGKLDALIYLAGLLAWSSTWADAKTIVRLVVAVIRA